MAISGKAGMSINAMNIPTKTYPIAIKTSESFIPNINDGPTKMQLTALNKLVTIMVRFFSIHLG